MQYHHRSKVRSTCEGREAQLLCYMVVGLDLNKTKIKVQTKVKIRVFFQNTNHKLLIDEMNHRPVNTRRYLDVDSTLFWTLWTSDGRWNTVVCLLGCKTYGPGENRTYDHIYHEYLLYNWAWRPFWKMWQRNFTWTSKIQLLYSWTSIQRFLNVMDVRWTSKLYCVNTGTQNVYVLCSVLSKSFFFKIKWF